MLFDDDFIAKKLNIFVKNAVSTLNVIKKSFITNMKSDDTTDPIDKAIDKYKFRPSIFLRKKHLNTTMFFSFKTVR